MIAQVVALNDIIYHNDQIFTRKSGVWPLPLIISQLWRGRIYVINPFFKVLNLRLKEKKGKEKKQTCVPSQISHAKVNAVPNSKMVNVPFPESFGVTFCVYRVIRAQIAL